MKINRIETTEEYMISLQWTHENLLEAKKFIVEWDRRDKSYYKNLSRDTVKFDMAEREHYRNCINFWEERLR